MVEIDDNADYYILDEVEMKLLLGGCGYDGLFAPMSDEEEDKRKLVESLVGLYRSKRISFDGEGFFVAKKLRKIIDVIGSSSRLFKITIPSKNETYYIYTSESAVICRPLNSRAGGFRLKFVELDELTKTILDDIPFDFSYEKNAAAGSRMWEVSASVFEIEAYSCGKSCGKIEVTLPFGGGINMRIAGCFGDYDGDFSASIFSDTIKSAAKSGGMA